MAAKDCTPIGAVFGKLTVAGPPFDPGRGRWRVPCQCECGNTSSPQCTSLLAGEAKSCGCMMHRGRNPKHGMTETPTYAIYSGMLSRCRNPSRRSYKDYGGRGIKVCDRWMESFENFYADMGPRPSPLHSLDRYPNVDGDYEPGNCRWATTAEQNSNRRSCVYLEYEGKRLTINEWSRQTGIPSSTLQRWHKQGMSPQEIFTRRKD